MSVDLSPAAREREQQPPDYASFCLVRDAALSIRDRQEVLFRNLSADHVEFNAIGVSTSLPDPLHAPLCSDVSVTWQRYGRKERLLVTITEKVLGAAASEGCLRQFGMTTKLKSVVQTWQRIGYPTAAGAAHEAVDDPDQFIQAMEGAALLEAVLNGTQTIITGDCEHMAKELAEFQKAA